MDTSNVSTDGGGNSSPSVAVVITDTLTDKVIALIVVLTGNDTVFTAFDITKQIREENPLMNVPHIEVNDMVLAEFNLDFCDDYERTLTDLTVGRASYVYHPDTVLATTHPLAVQPAAGSTPTSPTSPTPGLVPLTDTDLTVEKRLNIPKPFLTKLGLVPGKMVRVDYDTDEGVIMLTEVTASPYETLQVNADARLRLSAVMLSKAFGRLPEKFDISVSPDDMIIFVKAK
jgi:hypothetical protein